MATSKRLLVLTTGGTIAGNTAISHEGPELNIEGLLEAAIGHVRRKWGVECSLQIVEIDDVDSSDILPSHWTRIAEEIHRRYDDVDGFIVTHGTNTLAYTCAALSFALQNCNKPVVVTGSQLPYGLPGSDALANLENALRIATWPYNAVRGVLCVFGGQIISGTRAKKSTEFDYDAFQPFLSPSLGRIRAPSGSTRRRCAGTTPTPTATTPSTECSPPRCRHATSSCSRASTSRCSLSPSFRAWRPTC